MGTVLSTRSLSAPGVSFRVMLQLGDVSVIPAVGVYDTGLYDTATYGVSDSDAYMVDVTEYVHGFTTSNGRQAYTSRFRTGRATIELDNITGVWTPAGGTPLPGFLPLRPGRSVQIFAEFEMSTVQIYEGFVETIEDRYHGDGDVTTRLRCLDLLGFNAPVANTVAQPSQGGGELSYQRVVRIAQHSFDPAPKIAVLTAPGSVATTMLPTTLADDALEMLQITADSEGGGVFMSPSGTLTFTLADYFTNRAAEETSTWSVGNGGLGIKALERSDWSVQRVVNEAHFARAGGVEQNESNPSSIGQYGRRTHRRLDLQTDDDAHVSFLATRIVARLATAGAQLPGLSLQPSTSDEIRMAVLADIGDTVLVFVSTIFGWSYAVKTQIFGVSHSVGPDVWTVSFLLDDTEVVQRGAFSDGFSDGFDV